MNGMALAAASYDRVGLVEPWLGRLGKPRRGTSRSARAGFGTAAEAGHGKLRNGWASPGSQGAHCYGSARFVQAAQGMAGTAGLGHVSECHAVLRFGPAGLKRTDPRCGGTHRGPCTATNQERG